MGDWRPCCAGLLLGLLLYQGLGAIHIFCVIIKIIHSVDFVVLEVITLNVANT